MGIDLWFRVNISAPRPSILKVKVLNFPPIWGMCLNDKNPDFRSNRIQDSILKISNSSPGCNFEAQVQNLHAMEIENRLA